MILHAREFAGVAGLALDSQMRGFLGDVGLAVPRIGMVAHELRTAAAALFLYRLEHAHQVERVVSGARHQLNAQQVGLLLVLATVPKKVGAQTKLGALRDHLPGSSANDRPRNRAGHGANRERLLFRCPGGPVPQNHVAELVRHDAGDPALDRRGLNHAAVEVHGTARQRKRIDLAHVDDFEGVSELRMLQLGRRHLHQAPADAIHKGLDAVVSENRQLLLDFLRRLLTKFHILCRRVLVFGRRDARLRDRQRGSHHDKSGGIQKAAVGTSSVRHDLQAPL